jgi:hypothetical protein
MLSGLNSIRLANVSQSTFINDEDDWIEDENSVGQVKLGLWGLESLNKLRNTLAVSMRSIDHAKAELMTQINEVSFFEELEVSEFLAFVLTTLGPWEAERAARKNVPRVFGSI